MKTLVFLAILGLTLAGFRADMKKFGRDLKKAGDWIAKHHDAIETGLKDALKAGEFIAEHAEFVNVDGLIENGVQTYEDATQKKKNVGALVQDGLNIIGDLTSGDSNSEELFSWRGALHDAGRVAGVIGTGVEVAGMLSDDQLGFRHDMKKLGHDLHKAARGFVHGIKKAAHWVKDHGKQIETGLDDALKVGEFVAEHAEFVNVDGLIENGVQTYEDATQKKKNVGALVQDGLNIIGDLTSGNSNSEELFSWSDALHDAGDVAGIVGTGIKVAGLFADA